MTLIEHNKQVISKEVARLASKTSQNRVAYNAGVSNATISKVVRGDWSEISAEMWRRLQINLRIDLNWNHARTKNFLGIHELCRTAQKNSLSLAIAEDAGRGKSQAYTIYERENDYVVYIECKNYWSKKQYIETLLSAVGMSTKGTTSELIDRFIKYMKGLYRPLIIIDQFDKLKDSQIDLFMDFYNDLSHNCGFVLSGVKALEKRILNGVNKNKIGFSEIYSRVGRKFIHLNPVNIEEVRMICNANGITDEEYIHFVFNNCEQDLRRVRRDVEKFHLKTLANKEVDYEVVPSRPVGEIPVQLEDVKPTPNRTAPKIEIPEEVIAKAAAVLDSTKNEKNACDYIRDHVPGLRKNDSTLLKLIDSFRPVTA